LDLQEVPPISATDEVEELSVELYDRTENVEEVSVVENMGPGLFKVEPDGDEFTGKVNGKRYVLKFTEHNLHVVAREQYEDTEYGLENIPWHSLQKATNAAEATAPAEAPAEVKAEVKAFLGDWSSKKFPKISISATEKVEKLKVKFNDGEEDFNLLDPEENEFIGKVNGVKYVLRVNESHLEMQPSEEWGSKVPFRWFQLEKAKNAAEVAAESPVEAPAEVKVKM